MPQAAQTPEQLFDRALNNLLPELDPATELEFHFATLYARTSVLLEMAQNQLAAVNPLDESQRKLYFRILNQVSGHERAMKFSLNELRCLQTERALGDAAAGKEFKPTRLARLAIYTKPDGSPRKVTENVPPSPYAAASRAA